MTALMIDNTARATSSVTTPAQLIVFLSGDTPRRPARSKMLAVASNLFGKSSSLSAYTLHTSASPSPSSSSTNLPSTASTSTARTVNVGLWKVVRATHKTTSKDVSVWIFEKRVLDGIRGDGMTMNAGQSKDWVIEQLKKEVSRFGLLYLSIS